MLMQPIGRFIVLHSFVALLACSVMAAQPREAAAEDQLVSDTDWLRRDFWQTPSGKSVPDGWQFRNGEVALVTPRRGGNIVSPPLSPNFELSWQWQIEKGVSVSDEDGLVSEAFRELAMQLQLETFQHTAKTQSP